MSNAPRFSSMSSTNSTFPRHRTNTVTASHFFVLIDKLVSETKSDTDIIIVFQHFHFTAFGPGVEIDNAVFITEVHRNYVGITFQISNAYKTGIAMEDNRLDLLFVFDNKGFHGDVVVFMVLPQRTQRLLSNNKRLCVLCVLCGETIFCENNSHTYTARKYIPAYGHENPLQ